MGNTFGRLFRVTTWGESHGPGVGVVVDGCPPRIPLAAADVQRDLDRRRPGQSRITTQRREPDRVFMESGVSPDGLTLGTPIAMRVANADARGRDYGEMQTKYRPSHADYTYQAKYGIRAVAGGGRASARETVGRVAAGAVARRVLAHLRQSEQNDQDIAIVAWVDQVADVVADVDRSAVTAGDVDETIVRCPDPAVAAQMIERIDQARKAGDSLGGVVAAVARGVPLGLGAPVFDKLEADLAKAMLSLPAAKGFDIGSGFAGVTMTGSAHNDVFYTDDAGRVRTRTNRSGGVQGGISNGEDIWFRVAFKPTATILSPQQTVDVNGEPAILAPRGRHDPCVVPRAVPIVEAMCALVLCDHWLRHRGQCGRAP
jgi:chorismate synthase